LSGRQWQIDKRMAWKQTLTLVAPVAPDDVWAIAGGNFTSTAADGISPIRVMHWNRSTWQVALTLSASASLNPTGQVALSADDVYVMGQNNAGTSKRPFIDHWDSTRLLLVPSHQYAIAPAISTSRSLRASTPHPGHGLHRVLHRLPALSLDGPVGGDGGVLAFAALRVSQALRAGQVGHPERDRALGNAKLGCDALVRQPLAAKLSGLRAQVILSVRTPGKRQRQLAAQSLVKPIIAADVENFLHLSSRFAQAAERDCLLAKLRQNFDIVIFEH
jgi:hypothetical protein